MNRSATAEDKHKADPGQFARFLARLDPVPSRAWEAYDSLRRKLVGFFRYDYPLRAEDLAEEALDRVARKSDSQEIRALGEFAFGVARNLRRELARQDLTRIRVIGSEMLTRNINAETNLEDSIIQGMDTEKMVAHLSACLRSMKPDERRLVIDYYSPAGEDIAESRLALARRLGISMGSLRNRMLRLRAKLESCCHQRRSLWTERARTKARIE